MYSTTSLVGNVSPPEDLPFEMLPVSRKQRICFRNVVHFEHQNQETIVIG